MVDDKNHMPIPWPTIYALMSMAGMSPAADKDKVTNIDFERWQADGKPPTKSYLDKIASTGGEGNLIILILEGHGFCNGANNTGGDAGIMMGDGPLLDQDLFDRLFSKLPKGCHLLCVVFGCESGGMPMNVVWRATVPDCANVKVEKIEGVESAIQADVVCLCSSKDGQMTMAGDLFKPLEDVSKNPDVKKLGFPEFIARLQSVQKNFLHHGTIIEGYFTSHALLTSKVGQFLMSS